jgi:hypothetical protein
MISTYVFQFSSFPVLRLKFSRPAATHSARFSLLYHPDKLRRAEFRIFLVFIFYYEMYIYIFIYLFIYCGAATQRGSCPPHSRGF